MKDEFIQIDLCHYFKKDEIIGFMPINGEDGDFRDFHENKTKDYSDYYFLQIFLKNGTDVMINFGDDDDCECVRDAWTLYLKDILNVQDRYRVFNKYLDDIRKERSEV
tara:strand:- start:955 stop:1278 length:324 start_codon:yes stop_codon:yes gene_type:complete